MFSSLCAGAGPTMVATKISQRLSHSCCCVHSFLLNHPSTRLGTLWSLLLKSTSTLLPSFSRPRPFRLPANSSPLLPSPFVNSHTMVTQRTTATRTSSRISGKVTADSVAVSETTTTTTVVTTTADDGGADLKVSAKKRLASTQDIFEDGQDEQEEEEVQLVSRKKTTVTKTATLVKKGSVAKIPVREGAPVNMTMPTPLVLPPAPEGCIKITSWNVSGLNASLKKGFKTYINAEDADVICIQEHKVNQPLLNLVDPKKYPFSWWGIESEKKGYAGVAMFSKTTPLSVTAGLPTHPDPEVTKGRIVTLEFETTYLLGCYVPNAGQGLVRLSERMVWDKAMKDWLLQLKAKGKQIIWTGDLNVCHKAIDLRNPSTNTKSAGYTQEERDGFSAILSEGNFVDTFREIQGEDAVGYYSYYSYRFQCRIKGIGWRLDYFVTDKEMAKRVQESVIREECYGASDHLPIVLVVKGAL